MVPKKGTNVKRLTVDYKRLNQRTETHVGTIPNMEITLENIQDGQEKWILAGGTDRTSPGGALMTARGRIFRPKVMNFGFANAAPTFQELMNLALVRRRSGVKPLLERGAVLECHVDDVGLGTNTVEDHLVLLKEFLESARSTTSE